MTDSNPPTRSTNFTSSSSYSSSLLSKTLSDASTQNLSSILNNPLVSDNSWSSWWSSSTAVQLPDFVPPVNKTSGLETSRSDFSTYVSSISDQYSRFEDIRNHSNNENKERYNDDAIDEYERAGEALVACLREVPSLYFKEDFALEDGGTFRAVAVGENIVLQEKLTQYLDVVEVHLVKEISLRSNSFYEAQGQLEDLNVKIVEGCKRIRELKEMIRLLDVDLVDSARQVQDLNLTRSNLIALQDKLRVMLYVNQSLAALKLVLFVNSC